MNKIHAGILLTLISSNARPIAFPLQKPNVEQEKKDDNTKLKLALIAAIVTIVTAYITQKIEIPQVFDSFILKLILGKL